jgi:hypothetical protein
LSDYAPRWTPPGPPSHHPIFFCPRLFLRKTMWPHRTPARGACVTTAQPRPAPCPCGRRNGVTVAPFPARTVRGRCRRKAARRGVPVQAEVTRRRHLAAGRGCDPGSPGGRAGRADGAPLHRPVGGCGRHPRVRGRPILTGDRVPGLPGGGRSGSESGRRRVARGPGSPSSPDTASGTEVPGAPGDCFQGKQLAAKTGCVTVTHYASCSTR